MCLFRRSRLKGLPSCSESQVAPITSSQRPCATRARTAWRLAVALAGPLSPVPCLSCGVTAPSLSFLPSRLVCSEVLTCLPFPTAGSGTSPPAPASLPAPFRSSFPGSSLRLECSSLLSYLDTLASTFQLSFQQE